MIVSDRRRYAAIMDYGDLTGIDISDDRRPDALPISIPGAVMGLSRSVSSLSEMAVTLAT
jgi:hypothetical protein